jgi:hypothetical protein
MESVIIAAEATFGDISPSSSSSGGRYVDDEEDGGGCREVRSREYVVHLSVSVKWCRVLWCL